MSVPFGKRITKADAKAPHGEFRIVMVAPSNAPTDYFNMGDHADLWDALEHWRAFLRKKRDRDVRYLVYNDEGRETGVLGIRITEQERCAPPGKFRVVCVDVGPMTQGGDASIWLVADHDDRTAAIRYAKKVDQGPYTGHQVHDDTGAALIPV